jgi:hypothetical protein
LRGGGAQTVPQFTTCPHCSILRNGECVVCAEGDENHPSCRHCEGGTYKPPADPWYKDEIVLAIGTAVVVSVCSALIIAAIQGGLKKKD